MKNLLFIPALLALAACGMSEDKFADKLEDKFCDTLEECGDYSCDDFDDVEGDDEDHDCDFDSKAAKDCINGDWGCDGDFPKWPSACDNVYDCPEPGDDDDDDDDDDE